MFLEYDDEYDRFVCYEYHPFLKDNVEVFEYIEDCEYFVRTFNGEKYIFDLLNQHLIPLVDFELEYSRKLKRKLIRKNMTRQELADQTGLAYNSICNYVTGRSIPSYNAARKIAEALECSLDEFKYS